MKKSRWLSSVVLLKNKLKLKTAAKMNEAVLKVNIRQCLLFRAKCPPLRAHDVYIGERVSVNDACGGARCDDLANNSPKLLTDHAAQSTRIKRTRRLIHSLSFFIADHSPSLLYTTIYRERQTDSCIPSIHDCCSTIIATYCTSDDWKLLL